MVVSPRGTDSKCKGSEKVSILERRTADERTDTLERMMAENKTALMRTAYLYLGDRSLAEDAVQDAFLKAWRHLPLFRNQCSEKTWLTRILINVCKDMRKSAAMAWRRRSAPLDAAFDQGKSDRYRDDTVIQAVLALPDKDREVILLRFYQQMKVPEIAYALHIPEPTAATRLRRAKEKLYQALKGWYFDEDEF